MHTCYLVGAFPFVVGIAVVFIEGTAGTCDNYEGDDLATCMDTRRGVLLSMTPRNCQFLRRFFWAAILGLFIGLDDFHEPDQTFMRTLGVTSAFSSGFMIMSLVGFADSSMPWDPALVASAIPSGMCFLGAAFIFKELNTERMTLHGMLRAVSVVLAGTVGAFVGAGFYCEAVGLSVIGYMLRLRPSLLIRGLADDPTEMLPLTNGDIERARRRSRTPPPGS